MRHRQTQDWWREKHWNLLWQGGRSGARQGDGVYGTEGGFEIRPGPKSRLEASLRA